MMVSSESLQTIVARGVRDGTSVTMKWGISRMKQKIFAWLAAVGRRMGLIALLSAFTSPLTLAQEGAARFNIWVGSDPHVTVDTLHHGYS